jgi:hypothetical protein
MSGSLELPVSAAHPIRPAAQVGFDQFQHRPQLLLIVGLLVNLRGHVSPALWQAFRWCFAQTPRSLHLQALSRKPFKGTSQAHFKRISNPHYQSLSFPTLIRQMNLAHVPVIG